jgi:hypothetical protein
MKVMGIPISKDLHVALLHLGGSTPTLEPWKKPMLDIMNQHPPMHQLAILSIGWVVSFHPILDLALTNIVPQSNFYGC